MTQLTSKGMPLKTQLSIFKLFSRCILEVILACNHWSPRPSALYWLKQKLLKLDYTDKKLKKYCMLSLKSLNKKHLNITLLKCEHSLTLCLYAIDVFAWVTPGYSSLLPQFKSLLKGQVPAFKTNPNLCVYIYAETLDRWVDLLKMERVSLHPYDD